MPVYEWVCYECGASKTETIPVSEIGDGPGQRHPMGECFPCPKCQHKQMRPVIGGKLGIKMDFPLAFCDEKYALQIEQDAKDEQRSPVERYEEAGERRRGEARIRREGRRIFA